MRSLKVLVITMGVLIAAAVIAIVFALAARFSAPGAGKPWARMLDAPAGAAIRDYRLQGDRLVVRVDRPGKGAVLHILNARTGAVLGTVTLKNER